MLRLARLELSGFKSFVDGVGLDFGGGMTGIVGPNGCGKSNLADAMVWVMGERSARILRGQTMEDVIFGGSAKRRPLGMAEVFLTLTADLDAAPTDNGRVTIGRRLFRSGESHYLLNGKRTRLKQIRELLMDTGLGVRAYSVIEQGRIGMILSGKPLERRRLLEEAAGITHYRERRRLAEIKLEEARSNLARLDDIVAEVERALRSLKRQANAARRYGRRKERYRELLRQVLEGRWAELEARRRELRGRIDAEVAREAELIAHLHRSEAELAAGREDLESLNQRVADLHRGNAELAARIEGKQEFLRGSRHRLEEIAERLAAGQAEAEGRSERRERLESRIEELGSREAESLAERDRAASELTEDERRLSDVERLVADSEESLESLRARLLSSIGQINGLRNELHREQLELERGQMRSSQLQAQLAARGSELEEDEARVGRAAEVVEALQQTLDEGRAELDRLAGEARATTERRAELESRRDGVETDLAALERRREVLGELERAHRQRREEIRDACREAGLAEPGFLADRARPPAGWEASLDLFLGGLSEAVIVPPASDGLELAASLADSRVTVRLLETGDRTQASAAPDDAAVHSSLAEALGLEPAVGAALPPAYLVDSPADARRLARLHPGVAFIARGRLWAQAGALHVQGGQARPGAFARAQDLEEVGERIPPLNERLESLTGQIAEFGSAIAVQARAIEERERGLAGVREELAVARARHEDLAARHRRLKLERETLDTERSEVEREISRLERRTRGLAADLERAEGLHSELESEFDGSQKRVEEARGRRESARTSGASRKGRLELLEERLGSHRGDRRRVEGEIAEIARSLAAWGDEAERLERRRTEIREAMTAAESDLQEALERRDAAHASVRGEQERLATMREELRSRQAEIEGRRGRRDELRDAIASLRVEEAALTQDGEHLATDFREEFGDDLPEAPAEPPGELAELQEEMERIKRLLERLGPVNLLAADEYAEQEQRHEFLTEQRADVAASVARLQQTIREINKTSTERFRAAFAEVNEHFKTTFTDLFRGGTAEMRLLDEDDLLESGVEIVARPPGKRLQNIMLLSGGENALTAIALLFALFKTKPSPFCILDEVDAPLDDLNTLRFVDLLRRMSRQTQFIIITHNKITMEAVSTLYGVTMQEKGVSSLVSVELDELQPERESEPAAATA